MSVSYFAVDENLTASSMAYCMVWIVLLRFDNFMLYAMLETQYIIIKYYFVKCILQCPPLVVYTSGPSCSKLG